MFDFPNSPITNQIVAMPDGTSRKWDGAKWVAVPDLVNEAPTDGQIYGRQGSTASWIAAAPIASPTFTGTVTIPGGTIDNTTIGNTTAAPGTFSSETISPASGDSILIINGPSGTSRFLQFQTSGSNRWAIGSGGTAETGSNAGSGFVINRYSDTGTLVDQPFSVIRATGIANLPNVNIDGGTIDNTVIGSITSSTGVFSAASVTPTSGSAILALNGAAGTNRYNLAQSSGSNRWAWGVGGTSESGSNTGSEFFINRYSDAGAYLDTSVIIPRNTGIVAITNSITTPNVNNDQLAGFRNQIINGSFEVWQRGTSFSTPAANTYNADRWFLNYDGSGATSVVQRGMFSTTAQLQDLGFLYYLNVGSSVAGSGGTMRNFGQRMENVRTLSGRTITISAYMWADAARSVTVMFNQFFGSGGSATVSGTITTWNITTAIVRYTVTYTLPSIAGKTIGTNGDHYMSIVFGLPINTIFSISLTGVQVEPGTVATPYEWKPPGTEATLCQRFFQNGAMTFWNIATGASQTIGESIAFVQQMRLPPTITFTNPSYSNCSGLTSFSTWQQGHSYYITSTASGGLNCSSNFTAACEL